MEILKLMIIYESNYFAEVLKLMIFYGVFETMIFFTEVSKYMVVNQSFKLTELNGGFKNLRSI